MIALLKNSIGDVESKHNKNATVQYTDALLMISELHTDTYSTYTTDTAKGPQITKYSLNIHMIHHQDAYVNLLYIQINDMGENPVPSRIPVLLLGGTDKHPQWLLKA